MTDSESTPKRKTKKTGGMSDAEKKEWMELHPFTYVNIPLDSDTKREILEGTLDWTVYWRFMQLALTGSYKVGVSFDREHNCYIVSVTSTKFTRDDYNRCVTSRHSEIDIAFLIAMWKFDNVISISGIPAKGGVAGEIFD